MSFDHASIVPENRSEEGAGTHENAGLPSADPVANIIAGLAFLLSCSASFAQAQERDPMLLHDADRLTLRGHLQFGLNAVSETNLFWDLAATTAPASGFDPDTQWLEGYVKPGISFAYQLDTGAVLYGKLSAVASRTWGTDAFDTGNTGAATLEEAYLALRGTMGTGLSYDLSLGPRELNLGTGMLIANGATSGFERGALKFGPRKAWEMAVIGRLSSGTVTATAFYLDPNELPATDGNNELAGFDLRHDDPRGGYLGATYVHVLNSDSPYPQAAAGGSGPPTVTPGARDGTNTVNLYARTNPFAGRLENWTFTGDVAYQWNDRIDLKAWAGRVTAGYSFVNLPWSPNLTLGYQTFSGDDPNTTTLERFDPLYYQGSPSAWATGSKSASTFINSNVNALTVALRVQPTRQDTWTLRYAHIRANALNSPVQFGQATRIDVNGNVVAGVTDKHLADDLFLEYSRIINRNTFLTAGVSVSFPGAGIDNVIGRSAAPWTGGFVNVVFNF
ncbi:alginate export family protein [Seohaeicola sp.]|uniref:alginate export family protein n=2 Tax=Seohaeicola TaxID=481178 RepID=UPI003A8B8FF7